MSGAGRAWDAVLMERAIATGAKRGAYTPASNRILIALAYWQGDAKAAETLTRYLADLEPGHSAHADLLLAHRFDCPPPSVAWVRHVARKFNTFIHKSAPCPVGWPQGCNGTWGSIVDWVATARTDKGQPTYKAMFCCEADGGPAVSNWIEEMSREWDACEKVKPTYQAGPLVTEPAEHINGNCLLSCFPPFVQWLKHAATGLQNAGGWDYVLAKKFKKWGWANISRMRSYYNTPFFNPEQFAQMQEEKLVWVHGDKSGCLVDYGRLHFLR